MARKAAPQMTSLEPTSGIPASRPPRPIKVRRIHFGYAKPLERHFAQGDLLMSHVVAVLSAFFAQGEDFFVRSVRHYAERITDPALNVHNQLRVHRHTGAANHVVDAYQPSHLPSGAVDQKHCCTAALAVHDAGRDPTMAAYGRVGFHPNDNDNTALLDEWTARLFGEQGSLADHLM